MNVDKIKNLINKKSSNELQRYQFLGAEIKNCRLKLSKTLDSINNVSKSISYISKIENNKIIPNQNCLEELCTEFYITNKEIESMSKFDEQLELALRYYYIKDNDMLKEIYDEYNNFTNYRTSLMKGLYFSLINDFKSLKQIIRELGSVESSLSLEDYFIYTLLCISHLLYEEENYKVYQIINIVLSSNKASIIILNIINYIKLNLEINFGIGINESSLNKVINTQVDYGSSKLIQELILLNKEKQIELANEDVLVNIQKDILDTNLLCYIYLHLNNLEKAKKYYSLDLDYKYQALFYYKTNNISALDNMLYKKENLDKEIMVLINYYKIKLSNDVNLLRNYLYNICIPYFMKTCKLNILMNLYQELLSLNKDISKYKETCILSSSVITLIKDVLSLKL